MTNIRPKPSERYILELARRTKIDPRNGRTSVKISQGLLQCSHHGFYETPLDEFYPVLNLDEAFSFAAKSWYQRSEAPESVSRLTTFSDQTEIFSQIIGEGTEWLYSNRNLSPESIEEAKRLNPFDSLSLRERVSLINQEHWDVLKANLRQFVKNYEFKVNYPIALRRAGGDSSRLVRMDFQKFYPSKKYNSINFAKEIARMLAEYPDVYAERNADGSFTLPAADSAYAEEEYFAESEGKFKE